MDYEEILNEINHVFSSSDLRGTRETKMQVINFIREQHTKIEKLEDEVNQYSAVLDNLSGAR